MLPASVEGGATITTFTLVIASGIAPVASKEIPVTITSLEKGKIHKITLTFSAKNQTITPSATVTPWGNGATGDATVTE